jgi:hypothetical protein
MRVASHEDAPIRIQGPENRVARPDSVCHDLVGEKVKS